MSGLDVLIPCKALRVGKSRLGPVLDDAERASLCRSLLLTTIDRAMAVRNAGRIAVVSDDVEVFSLARAKGLIGLDDPGVDLNEALKSANAELLTSATESALLVLPIDLPFATSALLQNFVEHHADMVIAPDRDNIGTNLLWLAPWLRPNFPFAFGSESNIHHHRAAQRLQAKIVSIQQPELAFDLDTAEHYAEWRRIIRAT